MLNRNNIVEEEDIRAWHALAASIAEDHKPGIVGENVKKCWMTGLSDNLTHKRRSEEGDGDDEIDDGAKTYYTSTLSKTCD